MLKLLIVAVLLICLSRSEDQFLDKETASDYLNSPIQSQPLISNYDQPFIYTIGGQEKRREAKENFEEKCERGFFSWMASKPRWCPSLYEYKYFFFIH
jgi:hypothetical protein